MWQAHWKSKQGNVESYNLRNWRRREIIHWRKAGSVLTSCSLLQHKRKAIHQHSNKQTSQILPLKYYSLPGGCSLHQQSCEDIKSKTRRANNDCRLCLPFIYTTTHKQTRTFNSINYSHAIRHDTSRRSDSPTPFTFSKPTSPSFILIASFHRLPDNPSGHYLVPLILAMCPENLSH